MDITRRFESWFHGFRVTDVRAAPFDGITAPSLTREV